jgi:hypothetical protein
VRRQHETGAEVFQRFDRFQPASRVGGHGVLRRRDQIGIRLVV